MSQETDSNFSASSPLEREAVPSEEERFNVLSEALYKHCLVLARGNEALAQDVRQNTLVILWRIRHRLQLVQNELAFAKAIARNEALREMHRALLGAGDEQVAEENPLTPNHPTLGLIWELVPSTLSDRDVKILECRYVYGFTLNEIAKELGVSESTVKLRLVKIHSTIRRELGER